MESLKTLFKKYNYPSQTKLYAIAKQNGVKATHKEIKEFLSKQAVSQIFNRRRRKPGHIVAFEPFTRFQMDLIDMTKFSVKNNGFGWIYVFVDIFTRKIYAYLMKSKTEENIMQMLRQFVSKHTPDLIVSDNESGFKAKEVQKLFEDNDIMHDMVEPGDHNALGIVDRAIQTLKNTIYKYFKAENSVKYIDDLPSMVKAYNDTPHSGILGMTPNEATKPENIQKLQILNNEKEKKNSQNRKVFLPGDTVRIILKKGTFENRSFNEKYSDEQYKIVTVDGRTATLDNGDKVNIRRLIRVPPTEVEYDAGEPPAEPAPKQPDALASAKKEAKQKRALRQAGVDTSNIVETKRERKQNSKYFWAQRTGGQQIKQTELNRILLLLLFFSSPSSPSHAFKPTTNNLRRTTKPHKNYSTYSFHVGHESSCQHENSISTFLQSHQIRVSTLGYILYNVLN